MNPGFFDQFTNPTWDLDLWTTLAKRLGDPVLELGCGTGRVLGTLHNAGLDVTGVELDPELAKIAEHTGARVVVGDLQRVNLNRRFNTILAPCNTLSLFKDPSPALQNTRRHLTDRGHLLFDLVMPAQRPWSQPPYTWSRQTGELHERGHYDPVTRCHRGEIRWRTETVTRITWYRSLDAWKRLLHDADLSLLGQFGPTGAPATDADSVVVLLAGPTLSD